MAELPMLNFMNGDSMDSAGNKYPAGTPRTLPSIAPNGQATYAPNGADPVSNFNLRLLEMLKTAQNGQQSNAPLYARANELENKQTVNSMDKAKTLGIDNLRPGDALNARENQSNLYNPEINSINDRIKLNNETISNFEKAVKTAKEYGEEVAKTVKPDEATIQAVKDQMAAGFAPSASVLEKLGKYITPEDWNKLSTAKNSGDKPSQTTENINGISYRITYDNQGNVTNKVALGPAGDPDKPTDTETKDSRKQDAINRGKNISRGGNGLANPNDYLDAASDYVAAGGSANSFIAAVIPSRYLSPSDAEWVRTELNRMTPSADEESGW